jgi:hypothetical protein
MSDQQVYTLVPSTSQGRYALDDPVTGQDVTSGDVLQVLLGGQWVKGRVEHASGLYVLEHVAHPVTSGYYFLACNGGICGLCAGMKVRKA